VKTTSSTPASQPFSCLIVDDDGDFAAMLAKVVREAGGQVTGCTTVAAARREIERVRFDLVLLDNRLPDGTGFEFYQQLAQRSPASTVIMITGVPELAQAVELTRNGLFDYLTKPLDLSELAACLLRCQRRWATAAELVRPGVLVGESAAMQRVIEALRGAARHPTTTVLFLGETGTGKDVAARQLHDWTFPGRSPRPPYIALNCSAVPAEMFEAELFGSAKGAYTGADRRRGGLVEAAEGGTLFLDEVTEIPLLQQAKLLRFLESREYRALGNTAPAQFTGRIVAATNRSLEEEIKAGRFREDLRYRLDVFAVRLPPLRDHMEDLDLLAEFHLADLCERYHRPKPCMPPASLQRLRSYGFPGNIRELRNLLERSLLRTPDNVPWLHLDLSWLEGDASFGSIKEPLGGTSEPAPSRNLSALDLQEYQLVQEALRKEGGAIRRAAARLGLSPQALLRRLQKWPELRHGP